MYEYDQAFYNYINSGAVASAQRLLPALLQQLQVPVAKVLDAGCGAGAWLSVWKHDHGAAVTGLDGDYVDREHLLIEATEFRGADLAQGFDLDQRFDLVQSLEVAEHLPQECAAGFVESLCRHSDLVMFSAAPPGQGGENHQNEQPYSYWRDLFRGQGYDMYDAVRPNLGSSDPIKPWYRYNTFVYLRRGSNAELEQRLQHCRVPESGPVTDVSPRLYQLRKKLIAALPRPVSTALAVLKKSYFGALLKLRGSAR